VVSQWNFTHPWRRMKSYHSQVNGWRRTEWGYPGSDDQKLFVLPHMRTLDLGQIQQCCWTPSHNKGRAHTGHTGIGKKSKTWKYLLSPLKGANTETETLKWQRSIWEGDQELVKRSIRDESIWVVTHQCMEVMLGISLYSYPYLN
jgi:hypothetical protein